MKRTFFTLALLLVLGACGNDTADTADLWNDMVIADELYHFKRVGFERETDIVCRAEQGGVMTLRLTWPDGTPVSRLHMLACPEGYTRQMDAAGGALALTLQAMPPHDGQYTGLAGTVTVERRSFKTVIALDTLLLAPDDPAGDTLRCQGAYLSFDLTIFGQP